MKFSNIEEVKKQLEIAIKAAISEALKIPIHVRFLASSIQHTELQPEGMIFDLHFRVEVHPKKVETKEEKTA